MQPRKPYDSGKPSPPIVIDQEGSVYVGELKNGLPHGLGKLYVANGSYFNGIFKEGVPNG